MTDFKDSTPPERKMFARFVINFAGFEPWPLGVRIFLIAFLVIVASVAIAVFYLN